MMMIFDILAKNNSFDIIAMIFYFLYTIKKQDRKTTQLLRQNTK